MQPGATRRVSDPDGREWTVGRVWLDRRRLRSLEWRHGIGSKLMDGDPGGATLLEIFDGPDLGTAALGFGLLLALILVLIPLLLFGIELIILGFLLALGVVGRGLFGKPWTVAATPAGAAAPAALWRVNGWRQSGQLIDQVCVDLELRGQLASDFPQAAYIERAPDGGSV